MERELALKLIDTHGTNNPFDITTESHVVVRTIDLGKEIWGYYTNISRIATIHINERLDKPLQRFVCGHEFGHHLMHPKDNTPFLKRHTLFSIDKKERQANSFSTHLWIGYDLPQQDEPREHFLLRLGMPREFHEFYR